MPGGRSNTRCRCHWLCQCLSAEKHWRSQWHPTCQWHPTRGFTLVEVMVVLIVIAAMIAMALPSYQRAMEQSRADIAAANLRAIWAAQRVYWLQYQLYTDDLAGLCDMELLDPEIIDGTGGYAYAVSSADADGFQAAATRTGSAHWTGEFTIDETGEITGVVQAPGEPDIEAGFQ